MNLDGKGPRGASKAGVLEDDQTRSRRFVVIAELKNPH